MRQAAATVTVFLSLVLGASARARDGAMHAADLIARAQQLIDAKDYAAGTAVLEDVVLKVGSSERAAILAILKQAYGVMAEKAEAAGRDREAAHYRGNVAILNGQMPGRELARPGSSRVKPGEEPLQKPGRPRPRAEFPRNSPKVSRHRRRGKIARPAPKRPASDQAPEEPAKLSEPPSVARPEAAAEKSPSAPEALEPAPKALSASDGDQLFSAKRYEEAGRCYAALARENRLPANRTNHWAYCRMVAVASRMNARATSPLDWDEIEAEIVSIQRLAPKLWYGEYLRKYLADARKGGSRPPEQNDKLVVRASGPDESQEPARRLPRLFGKSRADAPTEEARAPADRAPAAAWNGEWQVQETPNFRIFHADARLAESVAQAAERVRADQAKRWGSVAPERPWAARCEIYLYPDGKSFAKATGQLEASPGFSTMESDGKQITSRKVLLHADQPKVLAAILPHEVTHVVVADLFVVQQIPRWADEGIAVLSEPESEQEMRAADLRDSLASGRVFDLSQLMSTETPEAKDWSVYYAAERVDHAVPGRTGYTRTVDPVRAGSGPQGNRAGAARGLSHRRVR